MSVGGIAMHRTKQPRSRRKPMFGVTICDQTKTGAIAQLLEAVRSGRHRKVAFCNAHLANLAWTDAALRRRLGAFLIFADGVGVDLAAKILHGERFKANLNGTDFVPALLAAEPRRLRIGLFGARPGVAERAAAALARLVPQHEIVLAAHGYGDASYDAEILGRLRGAPVDLLLVALGNPLQETWIARHVDGRHATLAIGVGALLDFLSDEVKRAPPELRKLRLEWLYRLAQEPRRLFLRYMFGNPLFLWRLMLQRFGVRAP